MLDLTICIINYNGERYLRKTLNSIYGQDEKFSEVILIDNASEDNSIKIVKENFPGIKLIQLSNNLGPGYARNTGFKAASFDQILFIDNDVCLSQNFSKGLVQALKEYPNPAIAMPEVYFAGCENKLQYNGADSHYLGLMILNCQSYLTNNNSNEIKKINSVVTACFLVDRKKWEEEKPFDESFFFNYEDHDFGIRTRIRGYEILSVSSSKCFHGEGTRDLSRREGDKYSRVRIFCLIKNRWQIILKDYELRTIILLLPALCIYEVFQFMGVLKKGWIAEWFRAVYWIASNLNHILHKRRIVQQSRKIHDREILEGGPLPFFEDLPQGRLEQIGKNILDFLMVTYWKLIKGLI